MDEEEDDEDYEHVAGPKTVSTEYLQVLSKGRLSIQYFQKEGNPKFISRRFLPSIECLIVKK